MSEQRKAIIIATGMDNTRLGSAIRSIVADVKVAGQQIKRGFMPAGMTEDLVNYYRRAGKASGAAFKQGQEEAGGSGSTMGKIGSFAGKFAAAGVILGGIKAGYSKASNAGLEARQTNWEAEDAGFSKEGYQAFLRSVSKTGGETEAAKIGIMKLVSTIGEARQGSTEAAAKFEKWKIAIAGANGEALSGEQIYKNIVDQVTKMSDPTQKAALMLAMFSKSYRGFNDAVDTERLKDAADWVHRFAPNDRELNSMQKMGDILRSAAKDNAFTRSWEMIKHVGRQGVGGMLISAGVDPQAEAKGRELDARLAKVNDEHQKTLDTKKQIARVDETTQEKAKRHAEFEKQSAKVLKDQEEEKTKKLKEQDSINKQLRSLYKQEDKIAGEGAKIDRETPSLEMLAGRKFTKKLDKQYGAGGIYDLEKGDGPFAAIAQEAMTAKKQQMWDIVHGNAEFDAKGKLIGGAAYEDRQRQIAAENKLGAAGLDTPAMKFDRMNEQLADIGESISGLLIAATTNGLILSDKPPA